MVDVRVLESARFASLADENALPCRQEDGRGRCEQDEWVAGGQGQGEERGRGSHSGVFVK